MRIRIPAAARGALAAAACGALAACGGAPSRPPPISNAVRAPARPEVLVFQNWAGLWQLRREGERASLTYRTERGAAEYEGRWVGQKLLLREVCGRATGELDCAWDTIDLYPAGAEPRDGCGDARARWTVRAVPRPALVCELAGSTGTFPTRFTFLTFAPGVGVETTTSECDRSDSSVVLVELRAMLPAQAAAARRGARPRCR